MLFCSQKVSFLFLRIDQNQFRQLFQLVTQESSPFEIKTLGRFPSMSATLRSSAPFRPSVHANPPRSSRPKRVGARAPLGQYRARVTGLCRRPVPRARARIIGRSSPRPRAGQSVPRKGNAFVPQQLAGRTLALSGHSLDRLSVRSNFSLHGITTDFE